MSRNSIVGLCLPGQWIEGCISSRAGGGSPKGPSTPSRCPLMRDTPPLMSAWRRSPIRSGPLSRPLSTFPLPQAGGKSLGTKVSLCFGPAPSFRQYFQFFLSWAESQQPEMGWGQRGYHSFAPALPPLLHLLSVPSGMNGPNSLGFPLACRPGPSPSGWPFRPR